MHTTKCLFFSVWHVLNKTGFNHEHVFLIHKDVLLKGIYTIWYFQRCTFIAGTHWLPVRGKCFCGCRKEAGVGAGVVLLVGLFQGQHDLRSFFHNYSWCDVESEARDLIVKRRVYLLILCLFLMEFKGRVLGGMWRRDIWDAIHRKHKRAQLTIILTSALL